MATAPFGPASITQYLGPTSPAPLDEPSPRLLSQAADLLRLRNTNDLWLHFKSQLNVELPHKSVLEANDPQSRKAIELPCRSDLLQCFLLLPPLIWSERSFPPLKSNSLHNQCQWIIRYDSSNDMFSSPNL